MHISTLQARYVDLVILSFNEANNPSGEQKPASKWIRSVISLPNLSSEYVNASAQKIFQNDPSLIPKANSKRNPFQSLAPKDELLKVIFEEGFHSQPQIVISRAEGVEGSFYPLWKRVCLIEILKVLGNFFSKPLVRLALCVSLLFMFYRITRSAFDKMIHLIIHCTPNRAMRMLEWVNQNKLRLFISAYGIQNILFRGPNIPYLTPLLRAADLRFAHFQTLGSLICDTSLGAAQFMIQQSAAVGNFFTNVAIQAEKERIAISKIKAYALWQKTLAQIQPALSLS